MTKRFLSLSSTLFATVSVITPAEAAMFFSIDSARPGQVDHSHFVYVRLTVSANSDVDPPAFTLGGGYSLSCEGGLNNPHPLDAASTFSDPIGNRFAITISVIHTIAGYRDWDVGREHLCTIRYRVRAAEGATGTAGSGFDFVFQVETLEQATLTHCQSVRMRKYPDSEREEAEQ